MSFHLTDITIGVDDRRKAFLKRLSRSKVGQELESCLENVSFDGPVDWNDVLYYLCEHIPDCASDDPGHWGFSPYQLGYLYRAIDEARSI